ncbi:MAG: methyl-accepting chemotaxis protein [Desulfonatronovibrio sp.]
MKVTIFWKTLGVMALSVLLVCISILFVSNYFVNKGFNEEGAENIRIMQHAVNEDIQLMTENLNSLSEFIAHNPDLANAIRRSDQDFLKEFSQNIIENSFSEISVITDIDGNVLARGHTDRSGDNIGNQALVQDAQKGRSGTGVERGAVAGFSLRSAQPILHPDNNLPVGVLITGIDLNSFEFADMIKAKNDVAFTIFDGDVRATTTIMVDGERAVGTKLANREIVSQVLHNSEIYFERNRILGTMYDTSYWPLKNVKGETVGMYFIGKPRHIIEASISNVNKSVIVVSIIILIIVLIAGYFFARSLSNPIIKTTNFASSVAEGNLNETLSIKNKDETGILANALNKMVENLKIKITEAEAKSAEAQEESEKAKIATKEAQEAKEKAEKAKQEGMLEAASQLEGIVSRVSSASEELSAQVEQSSRGAEDQKNQTTETATAMEQMNATVLEVAKNASSAAQGADQVSDDARKGQEIVQQSVEAINQVDQEAQNVKKSLDVLGKQAEEIGQIMDVIEDIADQTNLLALNAAIEAARAGDAGRGFAVVADEVRKLAEKTMNATKEVDQAIQSIQSGAKENIDGMDKASKAVREATKLAQKSGEALQGIVSNVEQAADQVRAIATATEEQSSASEQINRSVEDINRIASETADVMTQSAQAIGELAQQATELQGLIVELKRA